MVFNACAVAAEVRLAGSDLLGPELTKTLAGYTAADRIKFNITLEGSRPAYEQLKSGRAAVALITLAPDEMIDDCLLEALPLASFPFCSFSSVIPWPPPSSAATSSLSRTPPQPATPRGQPK